jgi:hypothetical protein
MRVLRRTLLGLGLVLACASCVMMPRYTPPPGLTPETGATLIGSKRGVLIFGQETYIGRIDGFLSTASYDTPVLVAPGDHTIDIAFNCGNAHGRIPASVTLEAGRTYIAECRLRPFQPLNCWVHTPDGVVVAAPMAVSPDVDVVVPIIVKGR